MKRINPYWLICILLVLLCPASCAFSYVSHNPYVNAYCVLHVLACLFMPFFGSAILELPLFKETYPELETLYAKNRALVEENRALVEALTKDIK